MYIDRLLFREILPIAYAFLLSLQGVIWLGLLNTPMCVVLETICIFFVYLVVEITWGYITGYLSLKIALVKSLLRRMPPHSLCCKPITGGG